MGVRGELFSSRVTVNGRTYFFNVKENRNGDVFLAIVESKPTETENFERRSIVVFKENMQDFLKSFEKALSAMEKAPAAKPSKNKRPARASDSEGSEAPRPPRQRKADPEGGFSLLPEGASSDAAPKRKTIRISKTNTKQSPEKAAEPKAGKPGKRPGKRLTVKKV
ncbi:MAG TPA: DUF3276 family protein [Spirochaetales bacterium]|nr:DUF3276 family protein [Spirochaetales bacterium]